LRDHQPVQALASVHHEDGALVPWQEEERGARSLVLRCRHGLREHAERPREPVDVDHWRVRCWQDGEHQEGHSVLCVRGCQRYGQESRGRRK
jgi:hypothetical protein